MAAADFASVRDNPFWKKKFAKACKARDVNKDGSISRSDFMMVVENYKRLAKSPPSHIERLSKTLGGFCDVLGLVDDSKSLTLEELEKKWLEGIEAFVKEGKFDSVSASVFDTLDVNGDGTIDFDEWRTHYECSGIPVEYAQASFNSIDTDNDGHLSKEEYCAYMAEFYLTAENKLNSATYYGPLDD